MMNTSQSQTSIGAAIGDAMSINVLMRLLPKLLASAGLRNLTGRSCDIWKDSHSIAGMMPDSLYIKRGCFHGALV